MTMQVRRVVTHVDDAGKSVVLIDDIATNGTSRRRGHDSRVVWVTEGGTDPNAGTSDAGARQVGRPPPPGGAIFRIMKIMPDQEPEMHVTETIDFGVVISGELYLILPDSEILLRQGDCLVQRGTDHAWENRGDVPCRLAVVLIDTAG